MEQKRCSRCKETKTLDAFGIQRGKPFDRKYACKECERIGRQDPVRKAKTQARDRAYRQNNPEIIRAGKRRWNKSDAGKAYRAKWIEENRERYEETRRAYVERNREKIRERLRLIAHKRREHYRKGDMPNGAWTVLLDFYGPRCMNPGCNRTDDLQLDHIVSLARGGVHHISNTQVLCGTCNRRKMTKDTDHRDLGSGVLVDLYGLEPMALSGPLSYCLSPSEILA